ncbi:AAA ATPase domain-containing protein [Shewanella morhuae]|uniref:ATP-binding protein n=1 Tax=Shewanella morhuae TaxID=365591 RepID=UPI000954E422|nr:ATP-binding protein [Shewanella morhuae]SIR22733.1 AAA ATPase domain-containing protein [Shewanella morhuae]
MKNLFELALIKEFSVFNLWGKDEISLQFKDRVTFLTGLNGSGKSSLLNVIFDSLIYSPKLFNNPSTSKSRFWSSVVKFDNSVEIQTMIFPEFSGTAWKSKEEINELLVGKTDFGLDIVRQIQELYTNKISDDAVTYISHKSTDCGEGWAKNLKTVDDADIPAIDEEFMVPPLGFLYQEDRSTLHNLDNCSLDRSSIYWAAYNSTIDERFVYCRDAVKAVESQANREIVEALSKIKDMTFTELLKSSAYNIAMKKIEGINKVIEKLNTYFCDSGKCITRDEDGKVTLGIIPIDANKVDELKGGFFEDVDVEPISWNLLSRGEKTLIYLFFAIHNYKDKVRVFLLDEPEISLHVKWQKSLIRDLSEIAPDNQFIIATHSPSLVMNGWLQNCLELNVK